MSRTDENTQPFQIAMVLHAEGDTDVCLQPKEVGLPVHAYVAREEVKPAGTEKAQRVFVHQPTQVCHCVWQQTLRHPMLS